MSERWPALLTRKEAAEYLSISPTSFSLLIAKGVIRGVKHYQAVRDPKYKRTDLDEYIESLEYGEGYCVATQGVKSNG